MTGNIVGSAWVENLRKGNLGVVDCPSRGILEHVTSRWGVLILILLLERTHRFNELGNKVAGVSDKMLAQTLRALEGDGFVLRVVHPTIPPKVEYSLTEMGREVATHVTTLAQWIEDNVSRVLQIRQERDGHTRSA